MSLRTLENQKTISFEMRRYQTHVTDGLITHNTKHGLNVSGLVLDEVHVQPNRKLYDVLTKGSGDAREQPLYFLITTAGTDKESMATLQQGRTAGCLPTISVSWKTSTASLRSWAVIFIW